MENPKAYSAANDVQRRDTEAIMREFAPRLNIGADAARVLDIGCGTGDVTAEIITPLLPKAISQIIGIDLLESMVKHARRHNVSPNLSFLQLDISDDESVVVKKLTDNNCYNRFDTILSFYCLHWVQNQRQALTNIFTLLKPGGETLLAFLADSTYYTMYQEMAKLPKWSTIMQDLVNLDKFYSPYRGLQNPADKLSELVIEAGFQVLKLECRKLSYLYENIADLHEAITVVSPFSPRLPENLVDEFFSDCWRIIEQFKLVEHTKNGHVIHYSLLVAHLTK